MDMRRAPARSPQRETREANQRSAVLAGYVFWMTSVVRSVRGAARFTPGAAAVVRLERQVRRPGVFTDAQRCGMPHGGGTVLRPPLRRSRSMQDGTAPR